MLKPLVVTLAALVIVAVLAPAARADQRIAGGSATAAPSWMAAILDTPSGELTCGGALIAPKLVLTAAHCVYGTKAGSQRVVLGRSDYNGLGGEERAVASIAVHPAYDPAFLTHDAALLVLSTAAVGAPVGLGDGSSPLVAGTAARVRGWGLTRADGRPSAPLRSASLRILRPARCAHRYGDYHDAAVMLCAGRRGSDPCPGDSGGPLTVTGADGIERIVGLVSSSAGCGAGTGPTNLTRTGAASIAGWVARRMAYETAAPTSRSTMAA